MRARQAKLMDEWAPQLLEMDHQLGEEEERRKKGEREWRDYDNDRGGLRLSRGSSDIADI